MNNSSVVYNFRKSCPTFDFKSSSLRTSIPNDNEGNSRVRSLIYQFEQQTDNSLNISNYTKFSNDSARSSCASNVCFPKMSDVPSVLLDPTIVENLMQKSGYETKNQTVITSDNKYDNASKIPRVKIIDTLNQDVVIRKKPTINTKPSIDHRRKINSNYHRFSSLDNTSRHGDNSKISVTELNKLKISNKHKYPKPFNIENQRVSPELSKVKVRLLENAPQLVQKPKGAIPKTQNIPGIKKIPPPVPIRNSSIDRKKIRDDFLSSMTKSLDEKMHRRNDWQNSTIPTLENSSLNKRRVSYLKATRTDNDFEVESPVLLRRKNSYVREAIIQFEKAMTDLNYKDNNDLNEQINQLIKKQNDEKETELDKQLQTFDNETTNNSYNAAQTDEFTENKDILTIIYHETQETCSKLNMNLNYEFEDFKTGNDVNNSTNIEEISVEIHRIDLNETDTNISDIIESETSAETDYIIIIHDNETKNSTDKTKEEEILTVLNENNTKTSDTNEASSPTNDSSEKSSTNIDTDSTCYEKHLEKALDKVYSNASTLEDEVEYMTIDECRKICFPMEDNQNDRSYKREHIYAEPYMLQVKDANLVTKNNLRFEAQDDNNNERLELLKLKLVRNSVILDNINSLPDKDDDSIDLETLTEMDFISIHEGCISDDYTEAINPLMSKNLVISEWIQNMDGQVILENCDAQEEYRNSILSSTDSRNSRSSGISEDIDNDKYVNPKVEQSLTYFDEHNNPMVKMVSKIKSKIMSPIRKDSLEIKIDRYEQEYLESIQDIVNNSRINDISAELIATEKTYIESLSRIVNDYIPELSKPEVPTSLIGKSRSIFGNADMLYEFHSETFLPNLELCKNAEEIAECFIENKDTFKLYSLYIKNKPKSDSIMRDHAGYFLKKKNELNDHFDISSYLLTPIQRLGRYILLIDRMAKEGEKENLKTNKLKQASHILQMQMRYGNDLIAIDQVVGYNTDLREQGTILLRDVFTVHPPNKRAPFRGMIFLFEQALLITSIELQNNTEEFVYREFFKLTDLGQTDNTERINQFKVWYRKHDQKSYTLTAKNPHTKKVWVEKIMDLLWIQLQNNKKQKEKEIAKTGFKMNMVPVVSPKAAKTAQSKYEIRDNNSTRGRLLSTTGSTTSSSSARKRRERHLRFSSVTKPTSKWYTKENSTSD